MRNSSPLPSVLYYRNGKAIGIIIIHGQGKLREAWIACDAPIILDDADCVLILWLAKAFPAAYTVVGDDNAAWTSQAQGPVQVLGIGKLVSINKNQIKGRFTLQVWEQVKRIANLHLGAVADACPGK